MEELLELDESHKIIGHIYKIVNTINNKCYIGQTRSHRLNRKKYRPFGYIGRFKDHMSESRSKSKKNQCTYLNSAFLKYGYDNFKCELITTCNVSELDEFEVSYIKLYNSKYPNGYNLTDGGQCKYTKKGSKITLNDEDIYKLKQDEDNLNVCKIKKTRSEETKRLISKRLTEYNNNHDVKIKSMIKTQKQHYDKKLETFKNCKINDDDIDQYIRIVKNNKENYSYVVIRIDNKMTSFVGKYEDIEKTKQRARMFILELLKWQDNLDAGTPLEPLLPLNSRNVNEELG